MIRFCAAMLSAGFLGPLSAQVGRAGLADDFSRGPLKVSDNKRFLVHADGTPFFYMACTGWEMFHRLDMAGAEKYLENRRQKGFNVIQAVVLAERDGLNTPNKFGHKPLVGNDPAKPNEEYFKDVDRVVDLARTKGIHIAMLPTWGAWVHNTPIFTTANARSFGEYLGTRYKDKQIIWVIGGDRNPTTATHHSIWRAMAEGVIGGAGGADKALLTFHPAGSAVSSTWYHDDAWLDFNMYQNGHCRDTDVWNRISNVYKLVPAKPILDGEPLYEDHPICFDRTKPYSDGVDVRKYAYWELFAGAHGHAYGTHNIWQMHAPDIPGVNSPLKYWYDALDLEGAWDMLHVRTLMESRPFLDRVPDQSVVIGELSGGDRIQATRGADYLFVYTASGQPITVNLGKIAGSQVKGYWFDPREGTSQAIPAMANTGTRTLTPPSNGYGKDWVLILDDASRNYAAPALPSPTALEGRKGKGEPARMRRGGASSETRFHGWKTRTGRTLAGRKRP